MSVVINYLSKYVAIIAADTRINFGRNAEFGYSDDNIKSDYPVTSGHWGKKF